MRGLVHQERGHREEEREPHQPARRGLMYVGRGPGAVAAIFF
jgi:hypothetical protein